MKINSFDLFLIYDWNDFLNLGFYNISLREILYDIIIGILLGFINEGT